MNGERIGGGERGQALPVIVVFLLAGLVVGVLRFLALGDLPWLTKAAESLLWATGTVVAGLVVAGLFAIAFGGEKGLPATSGSARAVPPEELNSIESELPERERPQLEGVRGRPPEEMAEAIRKMARGDDV